jgi:phosphopantetheine adenylyltransferase
MKIAELNNLAMEKVALFPGSFDPITVVTNQLCYRSLSLFDKVMLLIGYTPIKRLFSS